MARLDELERKFEENPRRYFAPLANEYRKSGDARRAAELCQSQLPEVPGHISGHIVLGQALYDVSDFAASRAALETALALDPENIVALRYLGDIARDTGDAAAAERWYRRTLEADPYNEAATAGLQSLQGVQEAADAAPVTAPSTASDDASESASEAESPASPEAGPLAISETTPEVEPAQAEPAPEPVAAAELEAATEQHAEGFEPTSVMAAPEPELDAPIEEAAFPGDLEISAAPDGYAAVETQAPAHEETATEAEAAGGLQPEPHPAQETVPDDPAIQQAVIQEEPIQTEERVMESAAPFVTETMADLYMEQGYPHEALELLLQLSEQRPGDQLLVEKIEQLKYMIDARRDAAVAAARAERAEVIEGESAAHADPQPAASETEPEPAPEHAPVAVVTMRDMFARMDKARPRSAGAVTPKPLARLRSDFIPLPEAGDASEADADPFAFPNPAPGADAPRRTSGPQPTFNPSTAATDDFDAWLRGLKGS